MQKGLFCLMNLGKTFIRINKVLWKVLHLYGFGRNLRNKVEDFHVGNKTWVRAGTAARARFTMKKGLRDRVMSSWLFNLLPAGDVREVKVSVKGPSLALLRAIEWSWQLNWLKFVQCHWWEI